MQLETPGFTKKDLAKYPFLKKTAEDLKKLELKLEEISNPEMEQILNRPEERVKREILFVLVGEKSENDIEIPSLPVGIMLAIAAKNTFIKKGMPQPRQSKPSAVCNLKTVRKY